MEAELNVRLPDQNPCVLPVFMTMQFVLSAGHIGVFDIMHDLMRAQGRFQTWQYVWQVCQRRHLHAVLSQQTEVNAETIASVVPILMAQN